MGNWSGSDISTMEDEDFDTFDSVDPVDHNYDYKECFAPDLQYKMDQDNVGESCEKCCESFNGQCSASAGFLSKKLDETTVSRVRQGCATECGRKTSKFLYTGREREFQEFFPTSN